MVDITVALPEGTAVTRDDAIRILNTELLAGKGPDVLALDGLPVQSYIDKGVLQDLSPTVQPMIDSGALLGNIVGVFKMGDAIPAVPTRFLMPSLWGDVEGMNTLTDMAAWAQANPDSMPAYAMDIEPLIGTFYLSCASAWFTGDGRLDEAKIEAFLTAMKTIRDDWTYEKFARETGNDIKARYQEEGSTLTWNWNPSQPVLLGGTLEEDFGCNYMVEGIQKQVPFLLRGLDSTTWPNGALAATKKGGFAPMPGQVEGCFVPTLLLGASKNAANGMEALKFIEYALGEESQNTDLSEGFQVNVQALNAAQSRDHALFGLSGGGNWITTWLNPDQQKKLRGMIEALKTPVIPDLTLYRMIVNESTPFFEGKIDAKQAAANVCAKANAYLSE
jgi:ABC-type glycerol-3-phosphate transport system substrate-binding protein